MNKRFYLAGVLALLSLAPINAQRFHALHHNTTTALVQKSIKDDNIIVPSGDGQTFTLQEMPYISFSHNKDYALQSWEYEKDLTKEDTPKLSYDAKGRLNEVTYPDGQKDRIVYGLDTQGRIITIDTYRHEADAEQGKEHPLSSKTFSYEHRDDATLQGDAFIVKDMTYSQSTDDKDKYIESGDSYTWCEPLHGFIRFIVNAEANTKRELTTTDNSYTITLKGKKDGTDEWVTLSEETTNVKENSIITKTYDPETGKLESTGGYKKELSWIPYLDNQKISKITTYKYDGSSFVKDMTEYEMYDANGNKLPYGIDYIEGDNGNYIWDITDDAKIETLTFFDKDGNIQRILRNQIIEKGKRINTPVEEYKDGKWVRFVDGTVILGSTSNNTTSHINQDGYVDLREDYENGVLVAKETFSYTDNGYKNLLYDYQKGNEDALYLEEECNVADDGTITLITKHYDNGEVFYGYKEVTTPEQVYFLYAWDTNKQAFSETPESTTVQDLTQTDDKGVTTTIQREWKDGKIEETGKKQTWSVDVPTFDMIQPENPLKELVSQDITSVALPFEGSNKSEAEYSYTKDETTQKWKLYSGTSSKFQVDGDTFVATYTNLGAADEFHHRYFTNNGNYKEYSYVRDRQDRLIKYQCEVNLPMGEDTLTCIRETKEFEYDSKGRITKLAHFKGGFGSDKQIDEVYLFHYLGDPSTGIDPKLAKATAIKLSVDGRILSATNCHSIKLYTIDGKSIASSNTGTITVPSAGLYIVDADGEKTKILIK